METIRRVCLKTDTTNTVLDYNLMSKKATENEGKVYGICIEKNVMDMNGRLVLETAKDVVENITYSKELALEMINKMADGAASPAELVPIVDNAISELEDLEKL